MTTRALSPAVLLGRSIPLFWRRNHSRERRPVPDVSPEVERARREFLQEMLARNPDGFSSELDVQSMMLFYSGKF